MDDVNTIQAPELAAVSPESSSVESPFIAIPQISMISPEPESPSEPSVKHEVICSPFGALERPSGVEFAPRYMDKELAGDLVGRSGGLGDMEAPIDSDLFGPSDEELSSELDASIEIVSDESWDGSMLELR